MPKHWRRAAAVVAMTCGTLLITGCAAPFKAFGVVEEPELLSGIAWQPCGAGTDCGRLRVPVDYERPDGPSIEIALARHRAEDPAARHGPLLINLGGPGATAVGQITDPQQLRGYPAELRKHFDLVGFDPRGVGASAAVKCLPAPSWERIPDDRAQFDQLVAGQRQWMAGCAQRTGELINHLDTRSAALDIEMIRQALGEEQISWLGYSYGTLLGTTYGEMFPHRVRAMVLDGVVDHSKPLEELATTMATAEEEVFRRFAQWCQDAPDCALSGQDVGAVWDRLVADASQQPIPAGNDQADDKSLLGGLNSLLYSQENWSAAGQAIADAVNGDASALAGGRSGGKSAALEPDPEYDSSALMTAVNCSDYPLLSADYDAIARVAEETAAKAPRFGNFMTWNVVGPCAGWERPATDEPDPLDAPGLPPVVLVNGVGDIATPLADARTVGEQLPERSFITVNADRHGLYAYGSPCIDEPVNRYLVDLAMPPAELRCEGP